MLCTCSGACARRTSQHRVHVEFRSIAVPILHPEACQPVGQRSVEKRRSQLSRRQVVEEAQLHPGGMPADASGGGDEGTIVTRALQRETAQRCEPAYTATLINNVHAARRTLILRFSCEPTRAAFTELVQPGSSAGTPS